MMTSTDMRRLSSRTTRFWKDRFPLFCYGFLIAWLIIFSIFTIQIGEFHPMVIIGSIVMALILHVTMRIFVNDLVDAVYDDEHFLIIQNDDVEDRIALSDIASIKYTYYMQNPPRISLYLRGESKFGKKVSFMLPYKIFLGTHPLVKELRDRVESSRA